VRSLAREIKVVLRWRHITAVIPEKTDQQANRKKKGPAGGRSVTYDTERYKQRSTDLQRVVSGGADSP
jgi:hypothetical protein